MEPTTGHPFLMPHPSPWRPVQGRSNLPSSGMGALTRLRTWAKALKREVVALWLAARDPRTPWSAKLAAGAVAAYALSPIDLIPDFTPVLGYLDDLLIVPLGIVLVVKLIPPVLMAAFREEALRRDRPVSRAGLAFIVAVWIVLVGLAGWILWHWIGPARA